MPRPKKEKPLQPEVEKELLRLLGIVDPKSIITFDDKHGIIYVGGERVDASRLTNLKAESEFILNSDVWRLLSQTIRHMAHEIMFTKSKTYEDMLSGKMLLYHLDVQQKVMNTLKMYRSPKGVI